MTDLTAAAFALADADLNLRILAETHAASKTGGAKVLREATEVRTEALENYRRAKEAQ